MIERPSETKIVDLLLPREQHRSKKAEYGEVPFTFELKNDRQSLYYFGANHSHDPENAQYPKLREYWQAFLKETESRDRIVLVEGWLRKIDESESQAIKNGSEGGLITYLAHQNKVPIECPDVSLSEQISSLPGFSKEEFLLSEFISYVDHLQRRLHRRIEISSQIQRWCDWQKQQKVWEGIDITPENILKIYEQVLDKPFSEDENFNAIHDPNKTGTRINELTHATSDLRDTKIVSEIKRYWDEGKNIFVVFGSGHLIIEEPALKVLLK